MKCESNGTRLFRDVLVAGDHQMARSRMNAECF